MDQTNTSTVPNTGDAGSIQATLDAMLAERDARIKSEVFRDAQRATDRRFAQYDAALADRDARLSRFEQMQQAQEEQNLDPEERQNRAQNRTAQQLWQKAQAAENANLQNHVWGSVMSEFAKKKIDPEDPRIQMPDIAIAADPRGWQAAMVQEIARIRIMDAEQMTAQQIKAAVEAERQKVLRDRDVARVDQNNERRAAATGQVERSVPSGTAMSMMGQYQQLKAAGKNMEARKLMEQMGQLAKAGQLRSAEAG